MHYVIVGGVSFVAGLVVMGFFYHGIVKAYEKAADAENYVFQRFAGVYKLVKKAL